MTRFITPEQEREIIRLLNGETPKRVASSKESWNDDWDNVEHVFDNFTDGDWGWCLITNKSELSTSAKCSTDALVNGAPECHVDYTDVSRSRNRVQIIVPAGVKLLINAQSSSYWDETYWYSDSDEAWYCFDTPNWLEILVEGISEAVKRAERSLEQKGLSVNWSFGGSIREDLLLYAYGDGLDSDISLVEESFDNLPCSSVRETRDYILNLIDKELSASYGVTAVSKTVNRNGSQSSITPQQLVEQLKQQVDINESKIDYEMRCKSYGAKLTSSSPVEIEFYWETQEGVYEDGVDYISESVSETLQSIISQTGFSDLVTLTVKVFQRDYGPMSASVRKYEIS